MQKRNQWIPGIPEKPLLQRSSGTPAELSGNQMETTNWQELLGIYSGILLDETICNGHQNVSPIRFVDLNNKEHDHQDVDAVKRFVGFNHSAGNVGPSMQNLHNDSLVWNVNPLTELPGMKNAIYAPVINDAPMEKTRVKDKPTVLHPDSRVERNWTGHKTTGLILQQNHVLHPNQDISDHNRLNLPNDFFAVPCWPNYNLNLPPRSEAGESSSAPSSFKSAPVTPDKQKQSKSSQIAGVPHLLLDKTLSPEKDEQENVEKSQPPRGVFPEVAAVPHSLIGKISSLERDKQENVQISQLPEDVQEKHDEHLNRLDSSSAAITTSLQEKYISEDKNYGGIDLNKTPQQKPPKRRKHRPKVIVEQKPQRTPKPASTNNNTPKENTPGKRKYKPKKDIKTSTQLTDAKNKVKVVNLSSAAKPCRRVLNFELENGVEKESKEGTCGKQAETNNENKLPFNLNLDSQDAEWYLGLDAVSKTSKVKEGHRKEYSLEKPESANLYSSIRSVNQILPQVSLPLASVVPPTTAKDSTLNVIARILNMRNGKTNQRGSQNGYNQVNQCISGGVAQLVIQANATKAKLDRERQLMRLSRSRLLEDLVDITEERGSKREYSNTQLTNPGIVKTGSQQLCHRVSKTGQHSSDSCKLWQLSSGTCKKKKVEGKFDGTSTYLPSCITTLKDCSRQVEGRGIDSVHENSSISHLNYGLRKPELELKNTNNVVSKVTSEIRQQHTLSQVHFYTEQIEQKKFHQTTEAKSVNNQTAVSNWNLNDPSQRDPVSTQGNQSITSPSPLSVKKQTTGPAFSSQAFSMDKVFKQEGRSARGYPNKEPAGSLEELRHITSVDEIIDHFKDLHIANNGKEIVGEEQSALIPYKRDSVIVPYAEFNPLRKHKPRPKVDLDPETNRLWNLLMGKEGSESTETMDEGREKRWEGERKVFHGRADSFIARMHLVQGDRRFSRWKGSVVDSVIGVFLTQNVSDHLSSSAYMSLAAKFPLQTTIIRPTCCQNGGSPLLEGRQVQIKYPGRNKIYDHRMIRHPVYNFSCVTSRQACEHGAENDKIGKTRFLTNGHDRRKDEDGMSSESSMAERIPAFQEYQYRETGSSFPDTLLGNQQLENPVTNRQNLKLDSGSVPHACPFTANMMHHQTLVPLSTNNQFSTTTDLEEWEARFLGLAEKESMSSLTSTAFEITPETSAGHTWDCVGPCAKSSFIAQQTGIPTFQESRAAHTISNLHQEQQISLPAGSHTIKGRRHETFQPGRIFVTEPNRHAEVLSEKPRDNLKHLANGTKAKGFEQVTSLREPSNQIGARTSNVRKRKVEKDKMEAFNWDSLRKQVELKVGRPERSEDTMDSLDYVGLRNANVHEISETIKERGMNNMLAERIKDFLDRLVQEHGRIDLEWLRYLPPDKSKDYLLSIRGLGLKSVECVRLLTLHHLAFPVDTNVGRIAVRLGWVPLQPLPESLQLHLLELYPVLESIQKYLWPRLCNLDQKTLYELHYQMITFGKVFCTKREPNCNACPMRGECRHFASAFASARLALPGPEEGRIVSSAAPTTADNSCITLGPLPLPPLEDNLNRETGLSMGSRDPIIEEPTTPEQFTEVSETDIEDAFYEDPDEIPTIELNIEQFTTNLQSFMQEHSMEMQKGDMSKALVALSPELAAIPMPKLKNVNRLRTEHQVYELPDSHSLLKGLDRRELDDPSPYLLAIWTPGETADSIQPPESKCNPQDLGGLCDKKTCLSCNSVRETQSQTVRGTLLIPCRTAMRGSFPLNGTYFQVNEVFADHESSLNPIDVPRNLLWNLPRRTVFFGTSVSTIFKGLSAEDIQYCFWKGFVCVRGFDQKSRVPRPLMARLHFPASKLAKKNEQKIEGSNSAERNRNRNRNQNQKGEGPRQPR
ncbi:transcriptional activator DEMETER-like [Olea europaea subsp. europaea]|uniref:Transcriptional activator DEMETER-like n=2 Tax=Olea europaea subsp. europaea TaxID=158383 RepID=A0A8S0U4E2_OLEEU|nr:transcriptional activator DEMETER-like [Olea europaea subsp. europaea]